MLSSSLSYPVSEIVDLLVHTLSNESTVILSAPPGAGKSTYLPLCLLEQVLQEGKKIIMLEPRRLAARALAVRMSEMLGESVGHTVGYRVRLQTCVSKDTRIEVVTEGILTRMIQQDNELPEVGMIIFDEFHERSLVADLALALSRDVQGVLRPDLKLLIMSATLQLDALADCLGAPVIQAQGKQYPLTIHYAEEFESHELVQATARQVRKVIAHHDQGDVLVFLPGEREIKSVYEALVATYSDLTIHMLYGALPLDQQQRALRQDPHGQRKIVLATSIAETSLTIDGVSLVIDTGYVRQQRYDAQLGISSLHLLRISQDMADQRAGRAARQAPGVCYRLWSKATQTQLATHRTPEILQTDLTSFALELITWGATTPDSLTWLTPPPVQSLVYAHRYLTQIGAITAQKRITNYGHRLQQLALNPRLGHLLLEAERLHLLPLACDVVAILQERDPLQHLQEADLTLRLDQLRRSRLQQGSLNSCWRYMEQVSKHLRKTWTVESLTDVTYNHLGTLLAFAYPERIARLLKGTIATYQLANGTRAKLRDEDSLSANEWIVVAHMDSQRQKQGQIYLAASMDVTDLGQFTTPYPVLSWDKVRQQFVAEDQLRIGQLVLSSKPMAQVDESLKVELLCELLQKEGERLLNWSEEVKQWQNRVLSVRLWTQDARWPDVTTEALLTTVALWLVPYLGKVKTKDDFQKIDLLHVLRSSLAYELQGELEQLAPERIAVSSGSRIKLTYFADGAQPVLAVRIQELFGMPQVPLLCQGRVKVLLHLLSPGFKPVQVTSDLASFWEITYFSVRKELKRRYPKHKWPDDPQNI